MGFDQHWIKLIMECISTVSYQFLINGEPSEAVKPSRGLRQGDPLSPYIFILCQNILSQLLIKAEDQKKIQGIQISRGSPPINHLLFADDSFIFFKTNVHSCRNIKSMLQKFYHLSGMKINLSKSELFTSANCRKQKKKVAQ